MGGYTSFPNQDMTVLSLNYNTTQARAKEMACCMKHLLGKHEDPKSAPQAHVKPDGACICNPSTLMGAETEKPLQLQGQMS